MPAARCRQSRALAPDRTDTLLFLAELERDAGNTDAAIGHYSRVCSRPRPGAAQQALDLARLLAAGDAYEEVVELLPPFRGHVSVELRLMLARALFEIERHAEVVEVTGPVVRDAELRAARHFMTGELRGELIAHMREATDLHDDSFADAARPREGDRGRRPPRPPGRELGRELPAARRGPHGHRAGLDARHGAARRRRDRSRSVRR